jgi:FkbM family methyltransferase
MGELLNDLIHNDLNFNNGFYIEAGANNGIRQSNTLFLERNLGWKGILVEPNIKKFSQCKQYRATNNLFYNCALSPSENITELCGNFSEDDEGESLAASTTLLLDLEYYDESFKTEIIKKINERTQTVVPAKTLNSILEENKINHVDFMSLDVEGFELEVLRYFNFSKYNISYILIETANRTQYHKEVKNFMENNGYIFYEKISRNDDLYKKDIL